MTIRIYALISFLLAVSFSILALIMALMLGLPEQVCMGSTFAISFPVSLILLCAINAGDDSNRE